MFYKIAFYYFDVYVELMASQKKFTFTNNFTESKKNTFWPQIII